MPNPRVTVDPGEPIQVVMQVNTVVFAEVSIYYRPAGEQRWVEAAFFSLHDVDAGEVKTTLPALAPGSGIKLRTLMWGKKRKYIIASSLLQNGVDCAGSPLAPSKGTVAADGTLVDVEVDVQ